MIGRVGVAAVPAVRAVGVHGESTPGRTRRRRAWCALRRMPVHTDPRGDAALSQELETGRERLDALRGLVARRVIRSNPLWLHGSAADEKAGRPISRRVARPV